MAAAWGAGGTWTLAWWRMQTGRELRERQKLEKLISLHLSLSLMHFLMYFSFFIMTL